MIGFGERVIKRRLFKRSTCDAKFFQLVSLSCSLSLSSLSLLMSGELKEWVDILSKCECLSERDMKRLCDNVLFSLLLFLSALFFLSPFIFLSSISHFVSLLSFIP